MIKAFIFDLDGTIVNTEQLIYEVYKETLRHYGYHLTIETWSQYVGGAASNPELVYKMVEDEMGVSIKKEEANAIGFMLIKEKLQHIEPLPGVSNFIKQAKKEHIKIGLATNAPKQWAVNILRNIGVFDYFDTIITVDDVKNPKPNAEMYQLALSSLQVKNEEAVAFEDSITGYQAAIDAGLYTVVIPTELTKQEAFIHAQIRVDTMEDLTPSLLQDKFIKTR